MTTLLCADDAPDIRSLVRAVLARTGVEVVPVRDGEAVLQALRAARPDAVLLDLEMPGLGGLETLRRIRADHALAGLPVAVMTGLSAPETIAAVTAAGATAVLAKPFEPAALRALVTSMVASGPVESHLRPVQAPVRRVEEAEEDAGGQLVDLRAQFQRVSGERIAVVEDAVTALMSGALGPDLRALATGEAHKLAGSLGTFGAPEGSVAARRIEECMRAPGPIPSEQIPGLADAVVQLRPAMARAIAGHDLVTMGPRLLIMAGDAGGDLAVAAGAQGYDAAVVYSVAAARRAVADARPAAMVVELGVPSAELLTFVAEVSGSTPPVPVVVLAPGDDTIDRLEIARRGARALLPGAPSPAEVLEAVGELLAGERAGQPLVLLVDDDLPLLGLARRMLEAAAVRVETLSDPGRFWDVLKATQPDLLVLDVDMPGVEGIDLCRVVRADPTSQTLPVLFLTARTDQETIQRIFAAGADDYIAKPFVGPELLSRIGNRLERARLLRGLDDTDPVAGVPTRRGAVRVLGRALAVNRRLQQPLAIAILALDDVRATNERQGHDAGDALLRAAGDRLRATFRGGVVGRWSSSRFLVGMPGLGSSEAARRLAELREPAAEGTDMPSFSAGVAAWPGDGESVDALARTAEGACASARALGRGGIVQCASAGTDDQAPDVLVVDDDETLASLLLHALKGRGYRVRWIGDGQAAADALVGAAATLRPRLILLDVNLPGLNGLTLLRRLADAGVTRRARVLMLTGRSPEAEVVHALELGAVDHIAKPFSLPVLMQRVHGALRG